jgi:YD repeat-containing protein
MSLSDMMELPRRLIGPAGRRLHAVIFRAGFCTTLSLSAALAGAQPLGTEPTGVYTVTGHDTECGNIGISLNSFDAAFDALKAYTHACPSLASSYEDSCTAVTQEKKRFNAQSCTYTYTKTSGDHVGGSIGWSTACPKDRTQNMLTGLCGPLPPEANSCPVAGVKEGNPMIPSTGEKVLDHSDHDGHGLHALSLMRSYRSSRVVGPATGPATSGLGQPWSHNHTHVLRQSGTDGTAGSSARIFFSDGSLRAFGWDVASGTWKPTNSADVLMANATGLQYKNLDDDAVWQFDTTGRLLTVTQRNGWVTTYTYSTASTPVNIAPVTGLLLTVRNHFGRALSFVYNASRQLASATAPDGRVVNYAYDSTVATGRLSTVSYPGPTSGMVSKSYLYENTTFPQLLTGIIDEKGARLATYAYDSQGRGISTQHAGGADLHTISYGAAGVATVTDPLGTQRTYSYGSALGKLAVLGADKPSGTGQSSAASRVQDANGFITQETDFLGVNTMYTWDINRRLPLTTTQAAALPEARTTTTQWHASYRLPVLVTESGRTTTYTYDSAGNRLSQTVTDTATSVSRTTGWTYNPQGLPATVVAPGGVVAQTYAYYMDTSFPEAQPPESFDPNISAVSLLLHAGGANGSKTVVDSSPLANTGTIRRNGQVSTTHSKFGGSSFYIPGSTDYGDNANVTGDHSLTGNFTVEYWMRPGSTTSHAIPVRIGGGAVYEDFYFVNNFLGLKRNDGTDCPFGANLAGLANTWIHVAYVRVGGTIYSYVNGVANGSCARSSVVGNASGIVFGYNATSNAIYYDELRITKGLARYTANFTPPTQAFPNTAPPVIVIAPNDMGHRAGDLQNVINAVGHVTQFTQYDRAGRVRQMVDPRGIVTDVLYTPRGGIGSITVTPPGGTARTTTYTYDNVGQLTGVVLPDSTSISYSYDAAQRLTGVTDAKGNSVTYTLDNAGNKTAEQVKDPSGNLQRNITRVYDALNRVQQVTGASN